MLDPRKFTIVSEKHTEYIEQAAHNADLASHLRHERTNCLDWAVTCLFYAAIHYVNAYLVKAHIPIPKRHRGSNPKKPGRLNIVQNDSVLSQIYRSHLDDERSGTHGTNLRGHLYPITTRFSFHSLLGFVSSSCRR